MSQFPSTSRADPPPQFFKPVDMYKTMHTDGYVALSPKAAQIISDDSVFPVARARGHDGN
jgi:archaeosine-15-forming tRNA-guanine transglycosylase